MKYNRCCRAIAYVQTLSSNVGSIGESSEERVQAVTPVIINVWVDEGISKSTAVKVDYSLIGYEDAVRNSSSYYVRNAVTKKGQRCCKIASADISCRAVE